MDSLIDYMHYLKLEIAQLRAQLADALAERKLYEPLLKEYCEAKEQPMPELEPMPEKQWDSSSGFEANPTPALLTLGAVRAAQ